MAMIAKDSFADHVTLSKDSVEVEFSYLWYAGEVKHRVEEYKSGKMETYPLDQDFWDRMDQRIDGADSL